MKILAILPHLICQRTHEKSTAVDDRKAMERRLELWEKGEVKKLLIEAEALQKKKTKNPKKKRRKMTS